MTKSLGFLGRLPGWGAVLGGVLFTACGGGAPSAPPPAPPEPADAPPPAPAPAPEPAEPEPLVYGVDLDTIHADRFDQGKMWTFEYPPVDYFAEEYGFRPDSAWFARARLGALRIPSCSASFVSPNGLVLTNHHCAREFLTQVQREGESLLDDGFFARDLDDERPVEDFEADQLVRIVDVSDEVNAALEAVPEEQRAEERERIHEEIEQRILAEQGGEDAGYVVEVISLWNGARTSAYVFRRYTNAKLVAAPELQIGFFGGDPDNFTYPRYNLDFSFFRIYDDQGRPLQVDTYFPVDDEGLEEGDPIFIVGNPGSTSRLQTVAQLEFRRDIEDRYVLELLSSRMEVLDAFIQAHPDVAEERDLRNTYFGFSNSHKAISGQVRGLEDPIIIARRKDTERQFQEAIEADPELAARYGGLIDEMAELQQQKREQEAGFGAFLAMSNPDLESATLYRALIAFQILSTRQGGAPQEVVDGLVEELEGVPQQHPELDQALAAARFRDFVRFYGESSQLATAVLQGQTPEERARQVIEGSVLQDSAAAVAAVRDETLTMADPAIAIVRAYLPAFIEFQEVIGAVFPEEERIAAELGRARFEIYGTQIPPDATFSLRIADGVVAGYEYNGTIAPAFTTLYGLYDRHYSHLGEPDWALPERWLEPPGSLDLSTPVNFVATADIIGGNSGSPVLDQELEVVGLVFDGNIESLPGDYIYLPESNRSVSVDVRGILEALDDVYDADRLVLELTSGRLVATEDEADRAAAR
ncbi:MAG TPA: S46 family peptidase [Longimicrobiales bacterium]|nr:S46 family peptidase [Longimicrobiales bacterium]